MDLSHLFNLFYQADRNLARSQGGLGIGLSLVRSLVTQHGGKVQAFSAGHGLGSEFIIKLPRLNPTEPTRVVCTELTASPAQSLSILVVDDNRDVAESLALLLEMDGHQVQIANDGQAALEMARSVRPDVILLDIGLPGMDGYAVAKALRQSPELKQMQLFALTGYGQPEDREKSLVAGFNEHLVKPTDFEKLRKLLADYQISSHTNDR
jgi:CheY-like chemotaxis protein